MRKLFVIGLPISGGFMLEWGLFSSAALLVGWIGTTALAAHQIALQVAAILFMVPFGISLAATVRVGHAVGRRDPVAARRAGFGAIALGAVFMTATTAIVVALRHEIPLLFLGRSDRRTPARRALPPRCCSSARPSSSPTACKGSPPAPCAGSTIPRVPMLFAAVSFWLIGFPSAYGLAFTAGLGAVGIWIGFSIARRHVRRAAGLAVSPAIGGRTTAVGRPVTILRHASGLWTLTRRRYRRPMVERLSSPELGSRGDGIADTPAGALYVPYTLPGETVEVDQWPGHPDRRASHQGRHREPRAHRADLPAFRHLRRLRAPALAPARYRAWKRALVIEALAQGAGSTRRSTISSTPMARAAAAPSSTRGAARTTCSRSASRRSGRITWWRSIAVRSSRPALDGAIEAAWAIAEALAGERKPLDIQVTATEAGLDVDVRGSGPLTAARGGRARARSPTPPSRAPHPPWRDRRAARGADAADRARAQLALPPGAFLQATAAGEADPGAAGGGALRRGAEQWPTCSPASGRSRCGSPNAPASPRPTTTRRDRGPAARRDRTTQGLKPIEALARDLFRRPFVPVELKRFDAVVFDPPRQGAEAQARELAASAVRRWSRSPAIPATFARDARILIDGGYRLMRVTPVDQFLYSAHVELVACFSGWSGTTGESG